MPYKDPAKRREQQKRYRQSEQGQAVIRRSRAQYAEKKRGEVVRDAELTVDPKPLEQVLGSWLR